MTGKGVKREIGVWSLGLARCRTFSSNCVIYIVDVVNFFHYDKSALGGIEVKIIASICFILKQGSHVIRVGKSNLYTNVFGLSKMSCLLTCYLKVSTPILSFYSWSYVKYGKYRIN